MVPVDFPQAHVVIAKDQPEYLPLPAHVCGITVTCCWRLNWAERLSLLFSGKLWHQILTRGTPLQPQALSIYRPPLYMNITREWERRQMHEEQVLQQLMRKAE